jgi:hypothetical protein
MNPGKLNLATALAASSKQPNAGRAVLTPLGRRVIWVVACSALLVVVELLFIK